MNMNVHSAKCMTPSPVVVLSDDLIAEVLSLLSVKSLLRLKCVSKSWRALISDPMFVKLHLKRSATRKTLFTLMKPYISKSSDDCDRSEGNCILHPALSIYSYYKWNEKDCIHIAGSCNGLICLMGYFPTYAYKEYWLRILNPATRTLSPKIGYFRDSGYFNFNFGYDNSNDIYKVVTSEFHRTNSLTSRVRILTLGDNVWRDIESFPLYNIAYKNRGEYLSGTLNWLAIDNNLTVEKFRIVSLDLRTETYYQYMLPRGVDEILPHMPSLRVLGDCLCFSYSPDNINFVIWKMQIFGVEESWVQFLKISYDTQCPHFDILFEDNLIRKLIFYNQRDDTIEESNTTTIFDNRISYYVHLGMAKDYVESLVSIF